MCIIIAAPAGIEIPKWELKNSWENNSDGAGLMYVNDGNIVVAKEFDKWKKFYELYERHYVKAAASKSPMVLHFRIGTHGSKGIHNVHPFRINDSVYFCHNGVLKTPDHKKWSDTMVYNKMYLQNLPEHFYKNFAILQLLEENIDSSKFVFLTKDRHIIILNKKLGEEDKKTGVWYSNSSFKALRFSSKSIASYFEGDDELYNEWYGKSSQRLLSEAPTSIQPIVPSMTICHKCHMTHDLKDLYPIDDISEDVYCKECKKEVLKNLSESCMWCDKKINKDEIEIELDSGEVFCTMCSEILKEMGTLDVAA